MQLLISQKGVSHGELCIVSEEPTTAVVQCFSVLKPGGLFFFKDYGPSHGTALTWHRRMKITLDIARGLEYLHERCNPPVIHIDLKSANIFLDSTFNAKISDFGLATTELLAKNKLKLSGTSAYVAPEYLSDGKLTDKK